ncbi:hypothetical protein [Pseudonocardia sp. ICBG1293]|nr:hypothetical protein [Pseudonocardia sp. ICBG1293]
MSERDEDACASSTDRTRGARDRIDREQITRPVRNREATAPSTSLA